MAPKKGKKVASVDDSQPAKELSKDEFEEQRILFRLRMAKERVADIEKRLAASASKKSDASASISKSPTKVTRSSKVLALATLAETNISPYRAADVAAAMSGRIRGPKETPRNSKTSPLLIQDDPNEIIDDLSSSHHSSDDSAASSSSDGESSPTPAPKGKKSAAAKSKGKIAKVGEPEPATPLPKGKKSGAVAKSKGKATQVVSNDSEDDLVKPTKSPGSSRKTTEKRASRNDERWVKKVLTPRPTVCLRCHNDFSKFPALTCNLVASKCTDCMSKTQSCDDVSFMPMTLFPC
jgi:hypothetical protein